MARERLSDEQIEAALVALPGWTYRDNALSKSFTLATFPAGIAFVDRVAALAEQIGHHPDMTIKYTTIGFTLSTHDAGGVTERDFDLARRIESLASA